MTNDITRGISVPKICEAVDCYETATEKVEISAGKFGIITLDLCHECLPKFDFRTHKT